MPHFVAVKLSSLKHAGMRVDRRAYYTSFQKNKHSF